jgi:hypothetical protein
VSGQQNSAVPSEDRRLLLRAALLDGEPGRAAFALWRSRQDLADLEPVSYRLLPLLYRNLERLDVKSADQGRLQGIYRHAWYANQRLIHAVGPGMQLLGDAGVPVVLLKGAALIASSTDGDVGVRPMEDVDVLVPAGDAMRAHDALTAGGWVCQESWDPAHLYRWRHSSPYYGPGGAQIDLHWRPLYEPGSVGTLWEAVTPARLGSKDVLVPSAPHQLVVTAGHGLGWGPSSLRWIADCALLVRRLDDEGWDQLVDAAQAARLGSTVAAALGIVADALDLGLPRNPMVALRRQRSRPSERLALAHKVRGLGFAKGFLASAEYSSRSRNAPHEPRISMLEHSLLHRDVTPWGLGAYVVRRSSEYALGRLRRR